MVVESSLKLQTGIGSLTPIWTHVNKQSRRRLMDEIIRSNHGVLMT